ncbi:MAG: hypothetical protein NTV22_10460, partial [bacterium]|nr:hypothetical protein [bacterium]
ITLSPTRKDVIIYLDYVGNDDANRPTASALQICINMFANAPLKGANAKPENRGVNLVFIVPNTGYSLASNSSIGTFNGDGSYNWTQVDTIKAWTKAHYGFGAVPPVYHYCLSCNNYGGSGSSGISRNSVASDAAFRAGAVDFILSTWGYQSQAGQAGLVGGTIAHEFGHNLGLTHGGHDHINYKPNYISIMNYLFQFPGLMYNGAQVYDYARGQLKNLDENKVNEKAGLGGKAKGYFTKMKVGATIYDYTNNLSKAVDWNRNGIIDPKYAMSMNNDGNASVLIGEDNWKNVTFLGGGGISGAGAGMQTAENVVCNSMATPMTVANICPPLTKAVVDMTRTKDAQATLQELLKTLKPVKTISNGKLTAVFCER